MKPAAQIAIVGSAALLICAAIGIGSLAFGGRSVKSTTANKQSTPYRGDGSLSKQMTDAVDRYNMAPKH